MSSEEDDAPYETRDYSKMRVGMRQVDNILFKDSSTYKRISSNFGDKYFILNAIKQQDYNTLRQISNYFYESSGIYKEVCEYLAFLYRYDYHVAVYSGESKSTDGNNKKKAQDYYKVLLYLDKSDIKRLCNKIALSMIVDGAFYGMIVDFGERFGIQQLPTSYCRSRFYSGVLPVVELNLQFFDHHFTNEFQRLQILKTFPKDIQQAYVLFKQGKLKGDYPGDTSCWYPLDPQISVKLGLNDKDYPPFVSVIPSIIDLDAAQEMDRQKTMQQLLKIIVQKLPLDKNGDLIFDVDEALDIHKNAVAMLRNAIGVDVLTTFADIVKIDTKDNNSATTRDDLEKVERTVFNNFGVSRNMFNADGNLAVTNAILTDEARLRDLPLQFSSLLSRVVEKFNKKNHYEFRVNILETTQYNYKEISKMYKEQAQMGYSKMLPQIALGRPQVEVISTLDFENDVLHLVDKMQPPPLSSTTSLNMVKNSSSNNNKSQNKQTSENSAGRPEKEDAEKSDKTISNRQSMT